MGRIENFRIEFKKQNPIYTPGECIEGSIHFRVNDRIKIKCIRIRAIGRASVHWTEIEGSQDNRQTVHFDSEEGYLDIDTILLKKYPNSDLFLDPDEYTFPFFIELPNNLPTSFEHEVGQIRYTLSAKIEIPWAFNKNTKKSFTVLGQYDLNENPSLRLGLGVSDQKYLCCWPCRSDPIIANFSLMKGGYVPGEGIVFDITVNNKSNRLISRMSVSLIQKIKFKANYRTKLSYRTIENFRFPSSVQERSIVKWDNSVLIIPPICPTSDGRCKIIDVSYLVLFDFCASGLSLTKEMLIPIVIGTIPLRPQVERIWNDELISYEECKFGPYPDKISFDEEDFDDIMETTEEKFKPLYPFFKEFFSN
ncbi:unnamed protein product [Brachionus calyciflorus]|uniref:Arrestin C-terminal-like domain-containing protein n=1 Tax=Brachionus calyciflorus TaxID=104777 RepID=A0A813Q2P1_9BILA|nr:unnamed protein product [Brachionus calyciflorus]